MGKHSAEDVIEKDIDSNDDNNDLNKKNKNKKDKKNKKEKAPMGKVSLVIGIILRIILLVSTVFLIYQANKTGMIPLKFMTAGVIILLVINLIFLLLLVKNRRNRIIAVISSILIICLSASFIYGALAIGKGTEVLNNLDINHKTLNFSVYVKKDSSYESLEDLSDKSMGYFNNEAEGMAASIDKIEKENDKIVLAGYDSLENMGKDLLAGNVESMVIEDAYLSILTDPEASEDLEAEEIDGEVTKEDAETEDEKEEDKKVNSVTKDGKEVKNDKENTDEISLDNFEDDTRVIYTFSIDLELAQVVKDVSVTEKTFNVYISGIDTYGNIASVSRSDVNIVATVNPETKQVLLTSIPRDYYVQLHGTTGLRDKLTHAGVYGVDKSISTIEDLLDIEINYYFKFNFTSVIDIVNKIGGVDVYSEYTFTSKNGYHYTKGYNHVDGKAALAFVRERKAFNAGDRQRGRNQQAMIDAMARKCMTPKILTKYSSLLNSLQKSFVTNMPAERISSLVKMQLEDGGDWTISSFGLTGRDSRQYTYSYSGQPLYVMVPFQNSIDDAKDLIKRVTEGEKLKGSYQESSGKVNQVVKFTAPKVEDKKENNTTNETEENTTNETDDTGEENVTNEPEVSTGDDENDTNTNTGSNNTNTNTDDNENTNTNTNTDSGNTNTDDSGTNTDDSGTGGSSDDGDHKNGEVESEPMQEGPSI